MHLSDFINKLVLLGVLALLVGGVWVASQWTRASLVQIPATEIQEQWNSSQQAIDLQQWEEGQRAIDAAISWAPGNSEYYNVAGSILEIRNYVEGQETTAEQYVQLGRQSLENYRAAIRRRPAWPYGWASFARQKALLGELDPEFDLALERVTSLGPWENNLQLVIAAVTAMQWQNLSETGRYYALLNFQRALSTPGYDGPIIRQFSETEFLASQVCVLLDQETLTDNARNACLP